MTPFPASAHRTGRAELLHPALGLDSRANIRDASRFQALDVDYTQWTKDLMGPESPCSVRSELVTLAEKTMDSFEQVLDDGLPGAVDSPEAEVVGPAPQEAVERFPQLRPRFRVASDQQLVDLLFEALLSLS